MLSEIERYCKDANKIKIFQNGKHTFSDEITKIRKNVIKIKRAPDLSCFILVVNI